MSEKIGRNVLLQAVKVIHQWHDMGLENSVFPIYYNNAPEMKMIRDVLGSYDEIKNEVIECNSISVEPPVIKE